MLLTSRACLGSQTAKLCNWCSGTHGFSTTTVLHASHCCTASLQALQEGAAAHRMQGSVLRAGCWKARCSAADVWSCARKAGQGNSRNIRVVLITNHRDKLPTTAHIVGGSGTSSDDGTPNSCSTPSTRPTACIACLVMTSMAVY
jgi:hypothetical protein